MESRNILICDDSESIRILVSGILQNEGYTVFAKNDGQEAYEFLLETKVDISLVITDLIMPRMNGVQLVKKIRQNKMIRFVPILILSTESQHSLKVEAKESGATGWIVKPFDEQKLIKTIKKIILS